MPGDAFAFDPDFALMGFNGQFAKGQAQPYTGGGIDRMVNPGEFVENPGLVSGGNTRPVIRNFHFNGMPVSSARKSYLPGDPGMQAYFSGRIARFPCTKPLAIPAVVPAMPVRQSRRACRLGDISVPRSAVRSPFVRSIFMPYAPCLGASTDGVERFYHVRPRPHHRLCAQDQ